MKANAHTPETLDSVGELGGVLPASQISAP